MFGVNKMWEKRKYRENQKEKKCGKKNASFFCVLVEKFARGKKKSIIFKYSRSGITLREKT